MRAATLVALGLLALRPLSAAAQEPPPPPGPPPEAPPSAGSGPAAAPMHPGMMHPNGPPMGPMGFGPAIRLRYGDLALSLHCSPRDDASACADAALKVLDRLRQMSPGEGGQGGAERDNGGDDNDHGDNDNGDNDNGGGDNPE